MIKKNTKLIFEDGRIVEDTGGIPLTEGELLTLKNENGEETFKVTKKIIECKAEGQDMMAYITYKLSKNTNK